MEKIILINIKISFKNERIFEGLSERKNIVNKWGTIGWMNFANENTVRRQPPSGKMCIRDRIYWFWLNCV